MDLCSSGVPQPSLHPLAIRNPLGDVGSQFRLNPTSQYKGPHRSLMHWASSWLITLYRFKVYNLKFLVLKYFIFKVPKFIHFTFVSLSYRNDISIHKPLKHGHFNIALKGLFLTLLEMESPRPVALWQPSSGWQTSWVFAWWEGARECCHPFFNTGTDPIHRGCHEDLPPNSIT